MLPVSRETESLVPTASMLLEALLAHTSMGLAFIDLGMRFVRINEALARINGRPVAAHLGRHVSEIVPALAEAVAAITSEIRQSGQPVSKELRGETPAQPGVTRTWHEHWFPVLASSGEIAGFGVLVEETTERTEAALTRESLIGALRTIDERLQFALSRGGVAIWEYDPQADTTLWSGDTAGTYGYEVSRMPVTGADYRRLLHPDDVEAVLRRYEEAVAEGSELRQDFRVCWPDGSVQWLHGRAQAHYDESGQLRRVTGVNVNVSERYAAAEALRLSEERLRLSMEAAYLIGFSWDVERDEVHRLHSLSEALPATSPSHPARFTDMLARVHPDDRAHFEQRIREAFADARGHYESEFRVIEENGTVRWLYERGTVSRSADGRVRSLSGLAQDITSRKSAEQALHEANRRKDEFLATLAHELRNPLAPIRSATEILRLSDAAPATMQRAVNIIDRQVTQMVRLVDDLLDVNRITRGDITLHVDTVDVVRAVHAAVETSRPLIEAARHELQLSLPFAPVPVQGDAARLSQALANLLNNAARYTPPGGRISLDVQREGQRVVIAVRDTGRGIPADRLQDIFDMFARVSPEGTQGGLGIGLALVRRIVHLHGGEIRAMSEGEGQGATFELWLPLSTAAASSSADTDAGEATPVAAATPEAPSAVAASADGKPDGTPGATPDSAPAPAAAATRQGLRILIVDDNVDFATSEATMLEHKHHIVCVVHDAHAALDVLPVFTPDVALLDIGMPGMSGYELARQLRADPHNDELVLVAQTGWGQPADKARAFAVGFNAHLTKPVDWATLEKVLARA